MDCSLLAALSCTKRDIRRNSSICNGSTRVIKDNYLHTLAGLDEVCVQCMCVCV